MNIETECSMLNHDIEKVFYYAEISIERAEELLEKAQKLYAKNIAIVGKKTSPNNKIILSWEFITLGTNIEILRKTIFLKKLKYDRDRISFMIGEIEITLGLDFSEDIRPLETLLKSANRLYSEQLEIILGQLHSVREKILPTDMIDLAGRIEILQNKIEQERPKMLRPYEDIRKRKEREAVARDNEPIDAYRESLRAARNDRNDEGSDYRDDSPMSAIR